MGINYFLLVGAGGAIGSMLRYGSSLIIGSKLFPYATLGVNIIGSLFIGILYGLGEKNNISDYGLKFFAVGICGGFTTFSAFSLESFKMIQQQRYSIFILYFLVSIASGVLATFSGYAITKQFIG